MSKGVYSVCRAIVKALFWLFSPVSAKGLENIPSGPAILAANHVSLTDPIKMAAVVDRPIAFMAKKELFGVWGLKSLLKALGAFPVDRAGGDFSAVKLAISILEDNRLFGIFPQGTREYKGGGEFKHGVALIAARSRAKVIPVYIDGRTRFFKRTILTFGKPVDFGGILDRPNSVALADATGMIEKAVRSLSEKGSPAA